MLSDSDDELDLSDLPRGLSTAERKAIIDRRRREKDEADIAEVEAAELEKRRKARREVDAFANRELEQFKTLLSIKRRNVLALHEWHEQLIIWAQELLEPYEPEFKDVFADLRQGKHAVKYLIEYFRAKVNAEVAYAKVLSRQMPLPMVLPIITRWTDEPAEPPEAIVETKENEKKTKNLKGRRSSKTLLGLFSRGKDNDKEKEEGSSGEPPVSRSASLTDLPATPPAATSRGLQVKLGRGLEVDEKTSEHIIEMTDWLEMSVQSLQVLLSTHRTETKNTYKEWAKGQQTLDAQIQRVKDLEQEHMLAYHGISTEMTQLIMDKKPYFRPVAVEDEATQRRDLWMSELNYLNQASALIEQVLGYVEAADRRLADLYQLDRSSLHQLSNVEESFQRLRARTFLQAAGFEREVLSTELEAVLQRPMRRDWDEEEGDAKSFGASEGSEDHTANERSAPPSRDPSPTPRHPNGPGSRSRSRSPSPATGRGRPRIRNLPAKEEEDTQDAKQAQQQAQQAQQQEKESSKQKDNSSKQKDNSSGSAAGSGKWSLFGRSSRRRSPQTLREKAVAKQEAREQEAKQARKKEAEDRKRKAQEDKRKAQEDKRRKQEDKKRCEEKKRQEEEERGLSASSAAEGKNSVRSRRGSGTSTGERGEGGGYKEEGENSNNPYVAFWTGMATGVSGMATGVSGMATGVSGMVMTSSSAKRAAKQRRLKKQYRQLQQEADVRQLGQQVRAKLLRSRVITDCPAAPRCRSLARCEEMQRQTTTLRRWKACFLVLTYDQFLYCYDVTFDVDDPSAAPRTPLWVVDSRFATTVPNMTSGEGDWKLIMRKTNMFGLESSRSHTLRARTARAAEEWVSAVNSPLTNVNNTDMLRFQKEYDHLHD